MGVDPSLITIEIWGDHLSAFMFSLVWWDFFEVLRSLASECMHCLCNWVACSNNATLLLQKDKNKMRICYLALTELVTLNGISNSC